MLGSLRRSRAHVPIGMAVVLAGITGCSYVTTQEELGIELEQMRAEVRAEIQQGDDQVEATLSQRIGTLETRVDSRIAALEGGLRELQNEFEVTVERFETAIRFNAPVHFAYDDATVREIDQPILDRFAGVVEEFYDGALITVEGFTDPAGSAEYNQQLGLSRAEAVRDYLVGAGLPQERVRAVSYGSSRDRQVVVGARGPGETGWQNRRVAMVIDFGEMAEPPMEPPVEGLDP